MIIRYTERFIKSAAALPSSVVDNISSAILEIEKPKKDSPLHVYPLEGRLRGLSAFTVNYAYHVIAVLNDEGIILLDIGEQEE